jgi:hypothetical protein
MADQRRPMRCADRCGIRLRTALINGGLPIQGFQIWSGGLYKPGGLKV